MGQKGPATFRQGASYGVAAQNLQVEVCGIPHLAKNERDVGHPATAKGTGLIPYRVVTTDPRLKSPVGPGLGFPVLSDSRQTIARRPKLQSTRVLAALLRRG